MTRNKSDRIGKADWIAIGMILLLALYYGLTLSRIPFHPDESTQIYMSKDFAGFFSNPLALSWDGDPVLNDEERIRAIDAPLAKYVIGGARALFSVPPLAADWDWSASWEENAAAGALPTQRQLPISRGAVTLLTLGGLGLFYLAVKKILPAGLALAALVLLGLNPLITLHGRRAMSEGALLFGVALFLWETTREKRSPWLIGLALGLAISAKHTAAALLPAGLYAAYTLPKGNQSLKRSGGRILKFLLTAGLVTAALNPFYWKRPWQSFPVGLDARSAIAAQQRADHSDSLGLNINNFLVRPVISLVQVFIAPPQTEEVGNYLGEIQESKEEYLANPLNRWGRDWVPGGIYLMLSLAGLGLAIQENPRLSSEAAEVNRIWILGGLGAFLLLLVPLPWQRYFVLLIPFTTTWALRGLVPLVQKARQDLPLGN